MHEDTHTHIVNMLGRETGHVTGLGDSEGTTGYFGGGVTIAETSLLGEGVGSTGPTSMVGTGITLLGATLAGSSPENGTWELAQASHCWALVANNVLPKQVLNGHPWHLQDLGTGEHICKIQCNDTITCFPPTHSLPTYTCASDIILNLILIILRVRTSAFRALILIILVLMTPWNLRRFGLRPCESDVFI